MTNDSENVIQLKEQVLDENWLEMILAESYHRDKPEVEVTVTSFKIDRGSDTTDSILSNIFAVEIVADVDNQRKSFDLIIKLLPVDPFSRYFVTEAEFDLREIKFYTKVIDDMEKLQSQKLQAGAESIRLPVAKCYLAKYVPFDFSDASPTHPNQINESVIVLENLKKKGYENVNFKIGLTLSQAESAIEAISRFHALTLAMKVYEKRPLNEKYDFLFQTQKASISYQQLMERGLPQLIHFLEKRTDMKDVINCLNLLRPKTKYLVETLLNPKEPISLITHTDFWSNNLLFRHNECIILDWQMVTQSQPTNDIALLIISSLPAEVRRQQTAHLLDHYWLNFTENSNKLNVDIENGLKYTKENLVADYRQSQLLALLLCVGSIDVALKDSDIEQRLIDVLKDLSSEGILSPEFLNEL